MGEVGDAGEVGVEGIMVEAGPFTLVK